MESIPKDFISDFEEYWIKKLTENRKFESLTEEEITEKIDAVKKNCFLLKIKNEIFERYLRRHNFGALREMDQFLKKECYETSIMDRIFEEDEKNTTLKSKELLQYSTEIPDSTEQENIGFLIKVVEQEISELCLKSKTQKKQSDKKIIFLNGELESLNTQIGILEKVYNLMKEHYPDNMKLQTKEKATKIIEFIMFLEKLIKNVKVQIRKSSLASYDVKKEYIKLYRAKYMEDCPVLPADIKLLEIENEKLKNDLCNDNQIYLDLKYLLDNYQMKFKKQNSFLMKLKDKKQKLENDINIYDKRLISLEKCHSRLECEVMGLEQEKIKLTELSQFSSRVPRPKQYILDYEEYNKMWKQMNKCKTDDSF